jgi:peptidoglycan L-alanyl-D-glutamate endopeptidase CwlK
MTYKLSEKSLKRLEGVHADLVKVVKKAIEISKQDFVVIEGRRTLERQRYLMKKGATRTMRSRHLTGHAVDIAPLVDGKASWDWAYYYPVRDAMKQAAADLGIPVIWGGDWKSFRDGPHWELNRKNYP